MACQVVSVIGWSPVGGFPNVMLIVMLMLHWDLVRLP